MKRTTVFFTESLEKDLQGEARRSGKSVAAVVREALAEYIVSRRTEAARPSFVGCAAGARGDVAERHEELLWTEPHEAARTAAVPRVKRRKAR